MVSKFILILLLLMPVLQAKETIVIAFNDRGSLNTTSTLIKMGVKLAQSKWSKKAHDKYQLIFVSLDNSLKGVTESLEEAIEKYNPILIFGAIRSNQAFLINSVSLKHKIPFVTPFATHPMVVKMNPYAYRLCFNDNEQARKLVDFTFNRLKKRKGVSIINSNHSFSMGLGQLFEREFNGLPNTVISSFSFNKVNEIDKIFIEKIKSIRPEFIFLPSYQIEAATILAKLIPAFPDAIFIGPDSWGGGRLFHNIIEKLPFKFSGFYTQHYSKDIKSSENKMFLKALYSSKKYKGKRETSNIAPIAVGYDGINFIIKALESSQTRTIDKKLKSISYVGTTGKVKLRNNRNADRDLIIYKISNKSESYYDNY